MTTTERAVLIFVGMVIGVAIVGLVVFVRAWRQGWREFERAEAAATADTSDLF